MGKLPASLFYWGDFVRDPDLRRCTNAEVGVWIRCLCLMFEAEQRGVLATRGMAWSDEEIALAVGGKMEETVACVTSLVTKGVASRNASGALMNRRMYRDEKIRVDTKIRVQRFREKQNSNDSCNANCNEDVRQCTETVSEKEVVALTRKEQDAELIYQAYPRKVGHGVAIKAIRKAMISQPFEFLLERTTSYANSPAGAKPFGEDYRPHPATWFNSERYLDDPEDWQKKKTGGSNGFKSNAEKRQDFFIETLNQRSGRESVLELAGGSEAGTNLQADGGSIHPLLAEIRDRGLDGSHATLNGNTPPRGRNGVS